MLAVLDRLQLARVVLGGNSLGGEVAWRVATLAPERVDRLILVDAAGLPDSIAAPVPLGWRIARVPVLGKIVEWVLPRALVVQGLVTAYADPAAITDEAGRPLLRADPARRQPRALRAAPAAVRARRRRRRAWRRSASRR